MFSNFVLVIRTCFQPPVRDALDAFIYQRVYMDNTQKNAEGGAIATQDSRKKYPPQLLRR